MWPSLGEIMSYEVLIATSRSVFHNVSQSFAAKHRKHVATTCSNNLQQKKSGSICGNYYAVKWLRWCPIAYSLKTDRNVFCLIGGKLANRAILCCAACKSRRKRQTESEGNYRNYQFTRTSPRLVYTYRTDQADAHTHTNCYIHVQYRWCALLYHPNRPFENPHPPFTESSCAKSRVFGTINQAVVMHTTVEADVVAASSAHKPFKMFWV